MSFDWKMSMGNVITILVVLGGFIYGYGVQGSRVDNNTKDIQELKVKQEQSVELRIAVARMEEKLNYIVEKLPIPKPPT